MVNFRQILVHILMKRNRLYDTREVPILVISDQDASSSVDQHFFTKNKNM